MTLHPPFQIGPRLLPALCIGDAWLSLSGIGHATGREGRDVAKFILDLPDGRVYEDDNLQSGRQGFRGVVGVFETFLSFMDACGESRQYEIRNHLEFGKSENATIFPLHVADWCAENLYEIGDTRCELYVSPDSDMANEALIEE